MTIYAALLENGTFDIINQEETLSSITRTPNMVRLSYRDEQNKFITFEKKIDVAAKAGSLLVAKHRRKGRNNRGVITCRHRGGGHKRLYRVVDFRRNKHGITAKLVPEHFQSEGLIDASVNKI